MKKTDIINIVKDVIKEMRPPYGSHDNFQPTGQRRNLSGLPGVMEGDALIDSGMEAYKKIIHPKNDSSKHNKGAYARELKSILGNDDIKGYEFEDIEIDNEDNPTNLSAEQAIALTRVAKNIRIPFNTEDNPEMYRENKTMKKKNIKEVGTLVTTKGGDTKYMDIDPKVAQQMKGDQGVTDIETVTGTKIKEDDLNLTNDIGKDDYIDDEGRMAKSQLYKMGKYAVKLHGMLNDTEQLPAWVQAKITKASDYMSMVYHYLEYEFERKDSNLMEHVDKYNKRSILMEGAMKKFFKMFDSGKTDEEIVQEYAKRGTQVPEVFVSKARKQYEGLKKMKLELDMSEKEFRNSATKMVNNAEEGMEPGVDEKKLASGIYNEEDVDEVSYQDSDLEEPKKADISKDGEISDYELKRGKAIEKSIKDKKIKN